MYDIYDLPKSIPLGRKGEQYARAVEIDCAKMLHDYPGARLTLMQRRTRGETARIVKADVSDAGVITWSPDIDAMAVAGLGAIEIVATVDDKVAKSVIAATAIAPSLTPPDTDTRSGWVKDVLDASDAAQGAMAAAQERAAAAAGSAAAAQSSANAAAGSASAASKSAASAATSADAASGSASAAAQSAAEADTSAKASAASAAEAAGTLDSVKASADAAAGSARAAAESASDAADSKSSAAQSATDAAQAASAASGSASQSAAARDVAQAAAAAAGASASDAADSATAAAGSKDAAAQSASAAAASAAKAEKAAQDAAGIIDDDVIAEDSTWSSKQITDQNYARFTVSGNPAVCEDVLEGYPLELSASWEPKQDGSGTPSPDNVRPITGGRDSITFTRAEDGASRVVALGETVYGGKIDDGTLTTVWLSVTLNIDDMNNAEAYPGWQNQAWCFDVLAKGQDAGIDGIALCDSIYGLYISTKNNGQIYFSASNVGITQSAYKAAYAGRTVQVVYKKRIPPETKMNPPLMTALAGTNTISTDTNTVTVGGVKPLHKPIDDTRVGTDNVWSAKHTVDKLLPMQTVTGNPAVIETLEGYPMSIKASWGPIQEGEGEPYPAGGSKNVLSLDTWVDKTTNGITFKREGNGIHVSGTATSAATSNTIPIPNLEPGKYYGWKTKGELTQQLVIKSAATSTNSWQIINEKAYAIVKEGDIGQYWYLNVATGTTVDYTVYPQLYKGDTAPTQFWPYSNIRLIKGRESVRVTRKNGTKKDDKTLTLPTTIYGGEVDAVTGVGTKQWEHIASYAGESLPGEWISDRDAYADGAQPTIGAQVVYKLATPETFAATGGGRIDALAGTNTISTDADTVTITAPTPPQTTASAAEVQAAKLDYVAMMADVDVDDLTSVDDAGADTGMMDMPAGIEGSETDGKQEV